MSRYTGPSTFPSGGVNLRRGSVPANYESVRPPYQQRKFAQFPNHNYHRDLPPRANFVIVLRCEGDCSFTRFEVQNLLDDFKCKPDYSVVNDRGAVAGRFVYLQWSDALETVVNLWEKRLEGVHMLVPKLVQNVVVPSDTEELNGRLRDLFSSQVRAFLNGDLVRKWEGKMLVLENEIAGVDALLRRPKKLGFVNECLRTKEGLVSEKGLIARKIGEFKSAMECILDYLEGKWFDDSEVKVLRLKGAFNWVKIHCLMMRECHRLNDGLPIYAFRQEILSHIHCQQVMVLTGETGSGKSTQLVQFLADSRLTCSKSVVCTQPRKLAAISLARRVQEEASGCYHDGSVVYCPTYSSVDHFDSNVIFMTDNCLLQQYMNDKNLSGISCIIVDEAHERSLNTDLLLALIKKLLHHRLDLRLIIMSATADAGKLADYFFGCGTFHVVGRSFPVDIRYVPCVSEVPSGAGLVGAYVSDVVRMVKEIHRMEEEGTILAFLTSQTEVEWACEQFQMPSAVVMPLHGKLSHEDQFRVYCKYPGKRKVIFTTNIAETSLTIPGIKYVVDSGMVKESRFEPSTGMNVLKICRISQSAANQRAGRAGRTEPGKCYRLYEENDFKSMPIHQEPEICRVHLGVAVLRILALGIKNIEDFDFVDAPCITAIEMAIRNLIQLGAVTLENGVYELTQEGKNLVRLGIEPRVGKIILNCFNKRLGREGLVLAAVMLNSSSIFCRVGKEEDKQKSDRLKVQFCHCNGDLFTLLSVYKKWEAVPRDKRNQWSWDNSINAKSMRRCQETVHELETCLQHELNIIIPSYWQWNPDVDTGHDRILKNVILSSLAENVAMYSGCDQHGYEVALTGKHVQLHPACSLLIFSQRPAWVVFSEVLALSNNYLTCVTAIDFESLHVLKPPPLFDISEMDSRKLHVKVFTDYGNVLLKKFCGKSNSGIIHLASRIRTDFGDDRIQLEVDVGQNEVRLFASSKHMEEVSGIVYDALERERKWLRNECLEKCLYQNICGASPSVALFGAGAEIKHLELEKRYLTVTVYHSDPSTVDEKELLLFLERETSGSICAVQKSSGYGQDCQQYKEWGKITFLTPDAAMNATKLKQIDCTDAVLRVVPSRSTYGVDNKVSSFLPVRAEICWPYKLSRGFGFVKCETRDDVPLMIQDLSNMMIRGKNVLCRESMNYMDSVMLCGLSEELSEDEIFEAIMTSTSRKILNFYLKRGPAVQCPPCDACEEALLREISPFMPKRKSKFDSVHIQVLPPEPKCSFMKAFISFDGSLHLEAAKALEQIEGKVLPGCRSWQKIKCQQLFYSSLFCPAPVYKAIKHQLFSLITNLQSRFDNAECKLDLLNTGSCRVRMTAKATKTIAEMRQPLENLINGKTVHHPDFTPAVLELLFSREGWSLQMSIQEETRTYILFDKRRHNLRVFGPSTKVELAEQRLVTSLLALHESKQLDIHLRGGALPPDLMKKVVEKFGPDLHGLKEEFPGAEFTLNTRRHILSIQGDKDLKQKVEDAIHEIAQMSGLRSQRAVESETTCPICLCEIEDSYRLESCGHEFCRLCLVEQCDSAIKSQDTFPIRCCRKGCREMILITDLKSLLTIEKIEELFNASLGAFVAASGGKYQFCPSPDCLSVYSVTAEPTSFLCGVCGVETCTTCHMEYHPYLSCEKYREFKDDPDSSLMDWCKGKENVKRCPRCAFTIEKIEGCNHVECRCRRHICWVCLESFDNSDECYGHLRSVHHAII